MQAPDLNSNLYESNLYETDFHAWTQEQIRLLRALSEVSERDRQWHQLDLVNLIEEVESLGKQQRQELRNRLSVLLGHLLKWQYQPQGRSRSATIRVQRRSAAASAREP
jgi:rhamnogalacturonyl hydrolase YesR